MFLFNAFESSVLCMFPDILTQTGVRDLQENPVEMKVDLSFGFRVHDMGFRFLNLKLNKMYALSGMQDVPPCIPDSHLYRVTNARCRIGTVFSPDDGHIVARNM